MATYKRILKNKPNANGGLPIVFRVYKDDSTAEFSTPFRILKSQWDVNNLHVKNNYQGYYAATHPPTTFLKELR